MFMTAISRTDSKGMVCFYSMLAHDARPFHSRHHVCKTKLSVSNAPLLHFGRNCPSGHRGFQKDIASTLTGTQTDTKILKLLNMESHPRGLFFHIF